MHASSGGSQIKRTNTCGGAAAAMGYLGVRSLLLEQHLAHRRCRVFLSAHRPAHNHRERHDAQRAEPPQLG